jgi:hypothetical protein
MVCSFIDTQSIYTTCIKQSLRRSSWCYWSAVDCDGRAIVIEVGWRRCCLKDCWECLLYTGARLMGRAVQWSQRVDPAGSHLSLRRPAPIDGYIATSRTYHANNRTALLELNMLTEASSMYSSVDVLKRDPSEDTARNSSCIVAIVGYHENSVYRAVVWIRICVTVTSVVIWWPVGGSHRRFPHT